MLFRSSVVVVATNGVSGVIGPDGDVLARAPVRETAVLETEVTQHFGATPGIRYGAVVQGLILAVAVLGQVVVSFTRRRRRSAHTPTAPPKVASSAGAR